ncbi:NAD(P)-binding domain protein [Niveomyces insectorum RCEF 264]|uniref:NAD(P)-binding domain protein n=1 Tax=Niveomyces insectorum RCEF 264 TaxID=1081102 RepID=A0A167SE54_9HYPO|nr:NAD(P)-binding domain protein [Niveomyces insectorum RCEF 264]
MKLIVAGGTGYVATEVIRQSLRRPEITSVVALARKATAVPANLEPGSDAAKLSSVVVPAYDQYPETVRKALAGADACIWTVAITPSKSASFPFEEVKRVCQTSTLAGLRAIHAAGSQKPLRFVYMSGIAAERDQTKTPQFKPEYSLMRGETENQVLTYAAEHKGEVEALIVKPGLITSNRVLRDWVLAPVLGMTAGVPSIPLGVLSTVMLDQAVLGFTADTLLNDDMVKLNKEGAATNAKT